MAEWISKLGAVFSAVFASIGYFGPALAGLTGVPALIALAALAIYRPYFIGLAGLALIYSLLTTFWEKYKVGTLHPKNYQLGREEIILSATTLIVFLAIFSPYLLGGSAGDRLIYEGRGTVIHVDSSEGGVTLQQEVMKGFMGAMSMDYSAEPQLLRDLRPGDRVGFKISPGGFEFIVVEIWKEKSP